ncbi:MAG: hypothetical protein PWP34_2564 [Desulfuromonadales bacterium]|jgi:hypothetical protein|nr:hypothetical protein [Desulfuromonadales bacterium]
MANEDKVLSVGIVGGGRGGLEMLKIFADSDKVRVAFLVDRDPQAIAVTSAKERNIETPDDLVAAMQQYRTDFIIEATGSAKVLELLRENHREGTEILSSQAALMFYTVVHEGRRKLNSDIFGKISHIGEEIVGSTASVKKALAAITQVAFNLEMLSINAAIEAARAGVHGRSFAVVAEEVKTTAGQAKSLLASIEAVNNNNVVMSEELEELLNQLH